MPVLAFDTSTDRMSIALGHTLDGADRVWSFEGPGAAQSSHTLVPAIMDLMAQARLTLAELDAIAFARGPGAFTGLRSACAVAQGLAFGARARTGGVPVPVLPLDSLLVLAEQARLQHAPEITRWQVLALLDARMDQIYAGSYRWEHGAWQTVTGPVLASPQDLRAEACEALVGNVFANYGDRLPGADQLPRFTALPEARAMLRLAPGLLARGHAVDPALALPVYVRDKVASTTAERAATHAAALSAPASRP